MPKPRGPDKKKRKRQCFKNDPDSLTQRDMEVFNHVVIQGKGSLKTAKAMGIDKKTVIATRRKPAFRKLAIEALEEIHNFGLEDITRGMVENCSATKKISVGGSVQEVPDYTARVNAYKELAKVYGIYAPVEQKVEHSFSRSTDEELLEEIEDACTRLRVDSTVIESQTPGGSDIPE